MVEVLHSEFKRIPVQTPLAGSNPTSRSMSEVTKYPGGINCYSTHPNLGL